MTRMQHFLALCELDGIVSATTLGRACNISRTRAAEWLYLQAKRDRIVRVVKGRYGRSDRPVKPIDAVRLAIARRAQAKIRARQRREGVCPCGEPSPCHWRCFKCRRYQAAKYLERKAARKSMALAEPGGAPATSAGSSSPSPLGEPSLRRRPVQPQGAATTAPLGGGAAISTGG